MSKIVRATLLTLAIASVSSCFCSIAQAKPKKTTVCVPVQQLRVVRDAADHPSAYRDGYREGQESARKNEVYKPRTVGGEFARGFEEGYYSQPFTGQQYEVPERLEAYTVQHCNRVNIEENEKK
jgi:hypothetical protein